MAHRCDAAVRPSTAKLRELAVPAQKKGRSQRSGQVQGGNAQKGQRYFAKARHTALQQYGSVPARCQAGSVTEIVKIIIFSKI
jgi:hypothetical protein